METLEVGDQAPDFTLPDQEGKPRSLRDYRDQWVLLYFYPQDDTPACTTEGCTIRDAWSLFTDINSMVLGVSPDSVASHTKFAKKFTFPFPILSDEKMVMIRQYGAWGTKHNYGRTYQGIFRMSYLIDPKGKIVKIYKQVRAATHAAKVLQDLAQFQA